MDMPHGISVRATSFRSGVGGSLPHLAVRHLLGSTCPRDLVAGYASANKTPSQGRVAPIGTRIIFSIECFIDKAFKLYTVLKLRSQPCSLARKRLGDVKWVVCFLMLLGVTRFRPLCTICGLINK